MANAFNPTPSISSRFGAPMGRRSIDVSCFDIDSRLRLVRVRLDSGGYDSGGAYWGLGQRLFCVADCEGRTAYFRARDRDCAKAEVHASAPEARFYR